MARADGMGEAMKFGDRSYKYPWDVRPPLPELSPAEQDDYETKEITPLAEPDTEPLDAIADDLIRFGERLDAMNEETDDERL